MKHFTLSVVGLGLLACNALAPLPVAAQARNPVEVRPGSHRVEGKIIRMGPDHFIVRTRGNEELTVHVRPQTRFLRRDQVVQFTDLRVGSDIAVVATPVLNQQVLNADTITIVTEEAPPPAEGTLIEGEIVRVVGEDQVIVRTRERKEVTVFVEPRTTYLLNDQPARFTDLRAGVNVHAHVNVRDGRHMAHRVILQPRLLPEGQ